ncbi:ATP-sensitive inward rectifier potassium channel 11 [Tribolium castaneum]|uniref:ATP-sensitive inward rectifier potassium channel 12-like Protein n=1 Tax=Tribolium castaneum TaxID=7070 RepID=D6WYJ9_TRICA|nr:PREDICTED: ATP-sensitive inward rectifier potassium channel 11 [Tribolium castaneum]EFA09001.1 ATP-sensitive inward rectifier potassium channel 12-like Protein [Tribolium castaneum]|eukprot:XP_974236.1 PREDICTED: ATP-sensitive inward rectifier potassium channel 11 [Tribolium castaneum]
METHVIETEGLTRILSTDCKSRRRIILKNGNCNIHRPESKRQKYAFLQFTKLVDSSWTFTIFVFLITLLSSWLLFAAIWWLICHTHGDFEPEHLPQVQKANNFTPCVYHINNFGSCLLFSIETQHTVGYGIKATTDECPEAIFVNALQCIIGFIMQGIMAVIIFSKMTLPRLRSQTLLFSKKAVICPRNNKLCFMFRMGDMRKNHIIDAKVRAFYIRAERTVEGQVLDHHQVELPVKVDECKSGIFFNWPLVVFHEITKDSPLYYLSPSDLKKNRFEIVVLLEGTTQSTGQMTQAKSSYLPREIIWGKKFQSLLNFNYDRREFEADFSKFDQVLAVSTPLCSAAYIDDYNQMQKLSGLDFTPRQSWGELDVEKFKDHVLRVCESGGENVNS